MKKKHAELIHEFSEKRQGLLDHLGAYVKMYLVFDAAVQNSVLDITKQIIRLSDQINTLQKLEQ